MQDGLIEEFRRRYHPKKPERLLEAFKKVPRHLFVPRFSVDHFHWINLNPENLERNLPLIYEDTTLLLFEEGDRVSTISQPSLVLSMLDLLDVKEGDRVFELGAGSGWNAAMLGILTGPHGKVRSYEIIPEMAMRAQASLQQFDLPQVEIIEGDATLELEQEGQFEKGIFTAGAHDLPLIYFDKIVNGGRLLFVLKTPSVDLMLSLRKEEDHFVEEERIPCRFVDVTGAGAPTHGPSDLDLRKGPLRIYRPQHSQQCTYVTQQEYSP